MENEQQQLVYFKSHQFAIDYHDKDKLTTKAPCRKCEKPFTKRWVPVSNRCEECVKIAQLEEENANLKAQSEAQITKLEADLQRQQAVFEEALKKAQEWNEKHFQEKLEEAVIAELAQARIVEEQIQAKIAENKAGSEQTEAEQSLARQVSLFNI